MPKRGEPMLEDLNLSRHVSLTRCVKADRSCEIFGKVMYSWRPSLRNSTWRQRRISLKLIGVCPVRIRQRSTLTTVSRTLEDTYYSIPDEVRDAVINKKPVVALETTIYTHGLPYPDNAALAFKLEDIVRQNGAVPATVGVIDGVARVGLSKEELTRVAEAAGRLDTMKVSRRDIPHILGLVGMISS